MSGRNFIVTPRSWAAIEAIALEWRDSLLPRDTARTPIIELMEEVFDHKLNLFRLLAGDKHEMGSAEGYTYPNGSCIVLREDVYRGAWRNNRRDRFTAAHEFGHWVLHTNQPLARAQDGVNIPGYRLSEPQANHFASEILMPKRFFSTYDSATDVMNRHDVSYKAAEVRLSYLRSSGKI
jgi:Zn-dependent peptidase ImmA (M78 family)